jgi:tRNA (mo5U34)-methyltransferase
MRRAAALFQKKLIRTQQQLQAPFDWYPYDSLGNVEQWEQLLGSKRTVLDLAHGGEVLDIGCADGAVSFFLEQQGCRVEAVDLPSTNYNRMQGIRLLKEAFRSNVEIREINLDRQFTLEKTYGLVLFLGILYHLKNPFYALETLARHSRFCLLSTRIAAVTPLGTPIQNESLAYLLEQDEANRDCTNFWIFSEVGLRRLAERTGWEVKGFHTRGCLQGSNPRDGDRDERAYCLLESRVAPPRVPVALLSGWHELEDNWRWTERTFSAAVAAPVSVQENQLEFRFHHVHDFPVTLTASVEEQKLKPQTFVTKGEHVYRAEVPARVFAKPGVTVTFELDRAFTTTDGDVRQMGVVVSFFRSGSVTSDQNLPLTFV